MPIISTGKKSGFTKEIFRKLWGNFQGRPSSHDCNRFFLKSEDKRV